MSPRVGQVVTTWGSRPTRDAQHIECSYAHINRRLIP